MLESVIPAGVKRQAGTREVRFFGLPEDFEQRLSDLGDGDLPRKQQAVVAALREGGSSDAVRGTDPCGRVREFSDRRTEEEGVAGTRAQEDRPERRR
ncbi:MAG: hypothetical protein CM1200mP2_30410 [Planctomycetaceae bacterium]|nr:MAG: hypothetical protein CM1200mP2_30410 [Planctomycetaceae bacterium]